MILEEDFANKLNLEFLNTYNEELIIIYLT